MYCTQGLESQSNMFTFDHTVYMYRSKVWSEREILRVYFHNTELLTKWGLSIAMIMDWVRVWDINDDEIPVFIVTESEREADIRVHFSGWSALFCVYRLYIDLQHSRCWYQ